MSDLDVSIVIPTYNSADFIMVALNSVQQQTGVRLELIVVDDLGTDKTREVLTAFKSSAPFPVQLIFRDSPQGQATARNLGIDAARGRYIAFLDSDDEFSSPTTLRRWIDIAEASNLEMTCAQYTYVTNRKTAPGRYVPVPEAKAITAGDWAPLVNISSFWQILYLRSFLDDRQIRFSNRLKQREDRPFFLEALVKAERIGVTHASFIRHYNRDDSSFRTRNDNQVRQFLTHCELISNTLNEGLRTGRFSAEFIQANLCIYYVNLLEYWGSFLVKLWKDPDKQQLIRDLFALYKTFPASNAPLYQTDIVNMSDVAAKFQKEGDVDLLHFLLTTGKIDLAMRVIAKERQSFGALFAFEDEFTPAIEDGICRYISFNRSQAHYADKAPDSLPALSDLIDRVVIHIGPPKTGTSIVQQTLERNRFELVRLGFHYPVTGANRERGIRRDRTPGHALLVNRLLDGEDALLNELRAEIADLPHKVGTLILSSENILSTRFWRNGEIVDVLATAFAPVDIEFVYVPRNFDSWFPSYFKESCANPWNMQIHSPASMLSELIAMGVLEPPARIEQRLTKPGNVKKVHRESYEALRQNNRLLSWFLEIVGLENVKLAEVNASLSNRSLSDPSAAIILLSKKMNLTKTRRNQIFSHLSQTENERDRTFDLIPEAALAMVNQKYLHYIRQFDGETSDPISAPTDAEGATPQAASNPMPSSKPLDDSATASALSIPPMVWKHFLEGSISQKPLTRLHGQTGAISVRIDSFYDEIDFDRNNYIAYENVVDEIELASRPGALPKSPVVDMSNPPELTLSGSVTFGGGWHETICHIGSQDRTDGAGLYVRRNHQEERLEVRLYTAYGNFANHTLAVIPCATGTPCEFEVRIAGGEVFCRLNDDSVASPIVCSDYRWRRNTALFLGSNIHLETDFLRRGDSLVVNVERFSIF